MLLGHLFLFYKYKNDNDNDNDNDLWESIPRNTVLNLNECFEQNRYFAQLFLNRIKVTEIPEGVEITKI